MQNRIHKPDTGTLLMILGAIAFGGTLMLNPQAFSGNNALRDVRIEKSEAEATFKARADRAGVADAEAKRRIDAGALVLVAKNDPSMFIALIPGKRVQYGNTQTFLNKGSFVADATGMTAEIGANNEIMPESLAWTGDPAYKAKIMAQTTARAFIPGQ